jgi:hypothetical protein
MQTHLQYTHRKKMYAECEQLPVGVLVPSQNINDDSCAICTELLNTPTDDGNDAVEALPACNHQFHQSCICSYFATQRAVQRCPLCRTPVQQNDVNDMILRYQRFRIQRRIDENRNKPRAFVYIIARNYKPGQATEDPLVFTIGHRAPTGAYQNPDDPWPYQRWGVPGGVTTSDELTAFDIVLRKFLEDTQGARGTDTNLTVGEAMDLFVAIGAKSVEAHTTVNNFYTALMIKIDSAEVFERIFLMPVANTVTQKMRIRMSNGTTGYCWMKVTDLLNLQRYDATAGQRSFTYVSIEGIQHPIRIQERSFTQLGFRRALQAYTQTTL